MSEQERSLTKNSQFCTLIPPPVLELKIGEVHENSQKTCRLLDFYCDFKFKLSEEL